jgi:pimeloyl-ACP methyl ester carboxylesterase
MQSNKRTNVRAIDARQLDDRATAARIAEMFLTTPPRRRFLDSEAELFQDAVRWSVEVEGDTVPVYRFGSGPAVLLVHGWGGSSGQLAQFIPPLLASGVSVVAFDAPGHGAATGTWLAIPRFAEVIARVAESAGSIRGVIAHSMGAAASAFATSLGFRADRLVFIGPPANEYEFFCGWFATLGVDLNLLPLATTAVVERVGVTFERLGADRIAADVRAPLLVIHDRDDREVPYANGAAIASHAPDGRLHTTRGLGHRRIVRDLHVIQTSVNFVLDFPTQRNSSEWSASNLASL